MLSQLLKLNGASKVVIAANKGIKMDIAKNLEAGDVYVELDRYVPVNVGIFRYLINAQAKPEASVGQIKGRPPVRIRHRRRSDWS